MQHRNSPTTLYRLTSFNCMFEDTAAAYKRLSVLYLHVFKLQGFIIFSYS